VSVLAAVATAVFLALCLAFDRTGHPRAGGAAKTLASAGFLALALSLDATRTAYGQVVLAALVLCALGDVLLISRHARAAFLAGLGSFLLGHLAFAAAFLVRGVEPLAAAGAALALALFAAGAWRWLGPHVRGGMRGPVLAYLVAICAMTALAAGAALAADMPRLLLGALAFLVSDLFVARERFVTSGPANRLVGLPLYYTGVVLLASTVA
jgi:uncharacterized membrane protein YhhN